MTDEEIRERLAQLIAGWWIGEPGQEISKDEAAEIAAFLVPTVRAISSSVTEQAIPGEADR